MKINIHAHHLSVTDAIEQHIKKKLSPMESHHQEIKHIDVTLVLENKISKAEAKIHLRGTDVFASAENDDMYVAIDALIPKLERQLKKHKEKSKNL